ncbi:HAD-IIB family hydrolase, partial [bacterium]|nr:HAD-IIB family hydrolase [bacterium]
LYIQLFSVHGLVRGANLEMGRDADTGGQVKYVIELASALGEHKAVRKVDLFTRLIRDKTVSPDYSQPVEEISSKVRIVRIQCGGGKYIRKELLWPHLDEYVDKTLKFVKDEGDLPDIVHGHYPDAGYVALELATFWGVPFVYTAHSLGRVKKADLEEASVAPEEINKKFRIDHRIQVEEEIIGRADLIVASTNQEVKKQYGRYQTKPAGKFRVIPPGIDLHRFFPFYDEPAEESEEREQVKEAQFYMQRELERFLLNLEKPLIFAVSRPDRRKNIQGLIRAYGQDKELQAIANLAIFAGIRKDIATMNGNEQEVLTELLLLMDKFDLYGKLAIPKRHHVENEIPELYRIVARSGGVFVNPAFKENFGLTLIEAAASGLPIVATDDGGPRDIIKNCKNGVLIDVNNCEAIGKAIRRILVDPDIWKEYSQNGLKGVREHYSWDAHSEKYIRQLKKLLPAKAPTIPTSAASSAIGKRFAALEKLFITDIDDTLLGDDAATVRLIDKLRQHRESVGFGVATGRPLDSAREVLEENGVPNPDVIISSVGTEIYYGAEALSDKGWQSHISSKWHKEKIQTTLEPLSFLTIQDEPAQRQFKLSFFMEESPEHLAKIHQILTDNRVGYNLIYSREMFLDILPYRASKGKAIRYLSYKWNIPLHNILAAGDSDNDEDMLRGEMLGVVVGNHHSELEKLRGLKHIYFSSDSYAAGILDGFEHYKFLP